MEESTRCQAPQNLPGHGFLYYIQPRPQWMHVVVHVAVRRRVRNHTEQKTKTKKGAAFGGVPRGRRFAFFLSLFNICCVIFHTAADHNMDHNMHPPWSGLDIIQKIRHRDVRHHSTHLEGSPLEDGVAPPFFFLRSGVAEPPKPGNPKLRYLTLLVPHFFLSSPPCG